MSLQQMLIGLGGVVIPPYVYVNSSFVGNAGGTAVTGAVSLTTGNCVFVACAGFDLCTTITDTAGNSYTALTAQTSAGAMSARWFYCLNATGNASNVTTGTFVGGNGQNTLQTFQFSGGGKLFDTETGMQDTSGGGHASLNSPSFNTARAGLVLTVDEGGTWADAATNSTFVDPGNHLWNAAFYWITGSALSSQVITLSGGGTRTRWVAIACFK
jgi:hypothetical protein